VLAEERAGQGEPDKTDRTSVELFRVTRRPEERDAIDNGIQEYLADVRTRSHLARSNGLRGVGW
jgi:hypothetical protein